MPTDADEVIACAACGTKNRIRSGLPSGTFRCGACQALLLRPVGSSLLARAIHVTPELFFRFARGATALTLFALPIWVAYTSITNPQPEPTKTTRTYTTPRPQLAPKPAEKPFDVDAFLRDNPPPKPPPPPFLEPEIPLPNSGAAALATTRKPIAPFEIKSSYGTNYLVKLADAADGQSIMTVFVRGGTTVNVDVPLGTYVVKYAAGDKWYGYNHLFGPSTSYSKATETFTFDFPGLQDWNERMANVDNRLLTFFIRYGLKQEVARDMLEVGFDKWRGWDELKANIAKNPKLIAPFNKLIFERNAIKATKPTTTTGYSITLYKVRDGNMHTQNIKADDF